VINPFHRFVFECQVRQDSLKLRQLDFKFFDLVELLSIESAILGLALVIAS
jgi:hypothetical protein